MAKKNIEQEIADLVSVIRIELDTDIETKNAVERYTYGDTKLALITEDDYEKYQTIMEQIYSFIESKEPLVSYEFFKDIINKLIINRCPTIYDSLMSELEKTEVQEYLIVRPLYGGYLKNNKLVKQGKYTFISKQYIIEYLSQYAVQNKFDIFLQNTAGIQFLCYVSTSIRAKDIKFALKKADALMLQLDNVIRYMSGNMDKNTGIGVFNFNVNLQGGFIVVNTSGKGMHVSPSTTSHPVRGTQLDDDWFLFNTKENKKIWDILQLKTPNEIQQRILNAVNWIGRAINEEDMPLSFLQCLFAIECLLQDQDDFITKSITAQICEYAAFIVGYDFKTRKEIDALFRELYRLRSKLAHGTFDKNIINERQKAIFLSKQIVINLLMKVEFRDIKTKKELREKIQYLRYQ